MSTAKSQNNYRHDYSDGFHFKLLAEKRTGGIYDVPLFISEFIGTMSLASSAFPKMSI
jgi:hypothetical protein